MVKTFKSQHPEWESRANGELLFQTIPREVYGALEGMIVARCAGVDALKDAVNDICGVIPCEPTTNWGRDYVISDLSITLGRLSNKPLNKSLDAIQKMAERFGTDFTEQMNELLDEHKFGYILDGEQNELQWALRDPATAIKTHLLDTIEPVQALCQQTFDHLKQIRGNLVKGDERSLKDAVRDAMSATEALLKSLSGQDDIAKATAQLKATGTWGPDRLVKDGLSIWHTLHELHPDIRHGTATATTLGEPEALYWIDRMVVFVLYLGRMKKLQE